MRSNAKGCHMPAISKITAKGQTTVPQEIRVALDSKPGDLIAWEVEADGRVAVRRIQPVDLEYLQAVQETLSEWRTAEDERAYGRL
jgi:antitoxin PrlF